MDEKSLLKNSTIIMDPKTPTVEESSNPPQLENYPGIPVVTDVTLDNTSVITNMDLQLFNVVSSGDVVGLKDILGYPEDTSILLQVTPVKDTLIHIAASSGHDEMIETILGYRSELLMEVNLLGETALHIAARAGYYATVNLLIDIAKRGNVESGTMSALMSAKNHQMETALHVAVSNSNVKTSAMIMEEDHASELLCSLNNAGESPLHVAVQKGNVYMVEEILKRSQLSYEGPNGRTALHTSIINETTEITRMLLKKELVQKRDVNGRTPLHFAAGLGFSEIVEMILGYDLSTTCFLDNTGYAAIHMAAIFGNFDIIKLFLRFQPYLKNLLDRSGQNLLQIAIKSEQAVLFENIRCEFEELFYGRDIEGNTILHQAVIIGNPFILNLLVRDKRILAISTDLNNKGCTALSTAMSKCEENSESTRVLVLATLIYWLPKKQRKEDIYHYTRSEVAKQNKMLDLKEASNTLMIVSALVVSVTFSAGLVDVESDWFFPMDMCSLLFALFSVLSLIPKGTATLRFARKFTIMSLALLLAAFSIGINRHDRVAIDKWYLIFITVSFTIVCLLIVLPGTRSVSSVWNMMSTKTAFLVMFASWRHYHMTKVQLTLGQRIEWMTKKIVQVPTAP